MQDEEFRKKIESKLQELPREHRVYFAWVAAVRALPFLGIRGNFSFWTEERRQHFLFSLLNALDHAAAAADSFNDEDAYADIYIEAFYMEMENLVESTSNIAYSSITSANVAASISAALGSDLYADEHAFAYAASYSAISAQDRQNDLQEKLFEDIKVIKNRGDLKGDLVFYGDVWPRFIKALKNEGCQYWGELYTTIFNSNFKIDKENLKKRLVVPKEYQEQGAAAVAEYLKSIERSGTVHLNEARIIILGDKGVGKTSIARRIIDPEAAMPEKRESTEGVETAIWELEDKDMKVHVWDFAGHVITHSAHQFFMSERCLYLIVLKGRDNERLVDLKYWLNQVKNYGGNSQIIVLLNKHDTHKVKIPINTLEKEYNIKNLYEFSIKDDHIDLEYFRNELSIYIGNEPTWKKDKISREHYEIKEKLHRLLVNDKNEILKEFINKDRFDEILKDYPEVKGDLLLKSLTELGVGLWYEDLKKHNTLVLNPRWISFGIYKIINWVNEQDDKYDITLSELPEVFKNSSHRYPKKELAFLIDMLRYYELAFKVKNEDRWIIPAVLEIDSPEHLPDFNNLDVFKFRFVADYPLPPDSISRLMVRHSDEIMVDNETYIAWRYGVLLEYDQNTRALVEEKDNKIVVSVKGPKAKAYLVSLRDSLERIFESYKSKQPVLEYDIAYYGQIPKDIKDNWLSEKKIEVHSQKNMPYLDEKTGKIMDLRELAEKFNIIIVQGGNNQFAVGDGNSLNQTVNFHKCRSKLLGELALLERALKKEGDEEALEEVTELRDLLKEAEDSKTPGELVEKGVLSYLDDFLQKIGDKNTKWGKRIEGLSKIAKIVEKLKPYALKIMEYGQQASQYIPPDNLGGF